MRITMEIIDLIQSFSRENDLSESFIIHFENAQEVRRWRFTDKAGRICSSAEGLTDDQALRFLESVASCTQLQFEAYLAMMAPGETVPAYFAGENTVFWRPDSYPFYPDELQQVTLTPPADHEREGTDAQPFLFESEREKSEALAEARNADRNSLTSVGHAIERLLGLKDGIIRNTYAGMVLQGSVSIEQALILMLMHLDNLVASIS